MPQGVSVLIFCFTISLSSFYSVHLFFVLYFLYLFIYLFIYHPLCVSPLSRSSLRPLQGAMLAYEALFDTLGAKFEPYVNVLLPHLLVCFGDTDANVRECTADASRVVMGSLTEHGVRMVMPLLLKSLEESQVSASANWV
jgi:hypothetical protein